MDSPSDAKIVVIGGGGVGCGVVHSLCQAGKTDVLLLEKNDALAAETTSQAAGLVGQVRTSVDRVKLAMWSVKTFSELEAGPDAKPGWRQVGSLRVALTDERVEEFKKMKTVADEAGLETSFISNEEARSKWPMFDFSPARSVLWCPSDGYLQPNDLAMAYAHRARRKGARLATGVTVEGIRTENDRVTGVETSQGVIACDTVINAAGAHAWHVAKMAGLDLPIFPVRHEYFVSVDAEGMQSELPVMRVPDASLYLRAEINGLLLGGWEPESLSLKPSDFENGQTPPRVEEDWDVMGWFIEQIAPLYGKAADLGVRSIFKGWPTFVPDGKFIIGESRRLKGFVMAGGCNAHGVSGSAGIGHHVVESMFEPSPSDYVCSLSPDRFLDNNWDAAEAQTSAQRIYETYYGLGH
ncbi:MAG: FAD-dependent oxidoreductase [Verrucomicrobiota bacterium]|nr:FAD-dependent oxidoreductase [Verrucomicrobiota bacterium]